MIFLLNTIHYGTGTNIVFKNVVDPFILQYYYVILSHAVLFIPACNLQPFGGIVSFKETI